MEGFETAAKKAGFRSAAMGAAAAVALAALASLCAGVVLCLAAAVSPIAEGTGGAPWQAQPDIRHVLKVSAFTLLVSLASVAVALGAGVPAAFFTARRNFPGRRLLLSLSSVPFCVPALIVALGYVSLFGMSGAANRLLMRLLSLDEPPLTFLYSAAGLVLAQGFYNFPIAMKTVGDLWARLPKAQGDAAALLGAGRWRIFRTVTLFQLAPAIVSASLPIFIYCFMSFMLVLLFGAVGTTTLEVEIYRAAKTAGNLPLAGRLALVETAIALAAVSAQCAAEERGDRARGIRVRPNPRRSLRGFSEIAAFAAFSAVVLLMFVAPLAGILVNALTATDAGATVPSLRPIANVVSFGAFRGAVAWTLATGAMSGALAAAAGFAYASLLASRGSSPLRRSLPMLPLAVSGVVVALGLSRLVRGGNFLTLVFAQAAMSWPIAFRQIQTPLSRIPPRVADAARLLSPSPLETVFRLHLPVARRGILGAFGFCFAISAGDTTLPLVLALPRLDTLALFTYRLAGAYRFHEACASGILLGAVCAAVFALSSGTGRER